MTESSTIVPPLVPSSDILTGAAAIAAYIGKTERQTEHLIQKRQLPAFKLGGLWHMRKSGYAALILKLEADAMAGRHAQARMVTKAA